MRVERVPPLVGMAALTTTSDRRSHPGFDVEDPARVATPNATSLAPPPTSVEMLVALASVDPAVERRRKMAEEADRGLALLERLHQESVETGVAPERLTQLSQWIAGFTLPHDPELAAVARDIELRVRVELAKYDVQA